VRREWSVYILKCRDGSLYTGVAKDVASRVRAHNRGKGSAYVRSRRPAEVAWKQSGFTQGGALAREARIKKLPRSRKLDGIGSGQSANL
jgi:putative endonuclease